MNKLKTVLCAVIITSRNTSSLLAEGKYPSEIFGVTEKTAAESADWKDLTPQLEITFRTLESGRQFKNWYNLLGYKKYSELTDKERQSNKFESRGDAGYAVDKKTGKRVVSAENTEKAMNILNTLAFNAGCDEGAEISEDDLVARHVGIQIGANEQGSMRVKSTYMLADVKAKVIADKEA